MVRVLGLVRVGLGYVLPKSAPNKNNGHRKGCGGGGGG